MNITLIAIAAIGIQGDDIADRAMVEAIATAHAANKAIITHGIARFRDLRGVGRDVDEVADGGWIRCSEAAGLYVFDGPNARYEATYPLDVVLADRVRQPDGSTTGTLMSIRLLTDGKQTLWDIMEPRAGQPPSYDHQTQIAPGTDSFFDKVLFPLDLHYPDSWPKTDYRLGELLQGARSQRIASVEADTLEGRSVVNLKVEAPNFRMEYWFDVERGAIPLRVVSTEFPSGRLIETTRHDDLRAVAGGRAWLPFRWTYAFADGHTKQVIIDEADFDRRPDRSIFRLDFDQPRPMVSAVDFVRYEPQASWSLLELPPKSSARAKPLPMAPPGPLPSTPPAMPGERDPRPWWLLPGSAALAVAALGGLILSIRRWRHA